MEDGTDTYNYGGPTVRGGMFAIDPALLVAWMNKRVTLVGVPPDAKYLRCWHEQGTDRICVVYSSEHAVEMLPGIIPYRTTVIATVENIDGE